jgi:WD40 repeat protein
MSLNKDETKLFTVSTDNQLKVWSLDYQILEEPVATVISSTIATLYESFKIPNLYLAPMDGQSDLSFFKSDYLNSTNFIEIDLSNNNFIFMLNKNGSTLLETIQKSPSNSPLSQKLAQITNFELKNATTIQLWNASYSSILLVGNRDGTIRIFTLLNQS